jgi:hypothetical protein
MSNLLKKDAFNKIWSWKKTPQKTHQPWKSKVNGLMSSLFTLKEEVWTI